MAATGFESGYAYAEPSFRKVIKMDHWPHEVEFDKELFSVRSISGGRIQTVAKLALKHVKVVFC